MVHGIRWTSYSTAAALALALGSMPALADEHVWNGTSNPNWNVGSNWTSGIAPSPNDSIRFTGNGSSASSTNNFSSINIRSLTMDSNRGTTTIGGNTLILTGFGGSANNVLVNNSSSTMNLNLGIRLSSNLGPVTVDTRGTVNANAALSQNFFVQSLRKRGFGTLNLNAQNTYTGITTIEQGTVRLGTNDALHATSKVVMAGGTLDARLRNQTIAGLTGNGTVRIDGGNLVVNQINSGFDFLSANISGTNGKLTKSGNGILVLSGNNSFTGGLTINGGRVRVTGNQNLGSSTGKITLDGGTLEVLNNSLSMIRETSLGAGGGTVMVQSGRTVTLNRDVSGVGDLTKASGGTLVLNRDTTYTGETNIISGTLAVNFNTQSSQINISSGGVLDLTGRTTLDPFSAALVNNGRVDAGSGTTFSGAVSGTGRFTGTVTFAGSYGPGNSPALVTHDITTFDASNVLTMEIGGKFRGTDYDAINADRVLLGGLLDIDLIGSFSPVAGETFDLIVANQITGAFSSFSFASLSGGLFFTTHLITSGSQMIYQLVVNQGSSGSGVPGPGAIFILVVGLAGMGVVRKRSA